MADRLLRVLDVGSGIGKAGRVLAARGCSVLEVLETGEGRLGISTPASRVVFRPA